MLIAPIADVVSPIDAVGSEFIDRTPKWLKNWAIEQFGTDDKLALRVGIWTTLAVAALVVGFLARRRPIVGVVGIALFGVVGAPAAVAVRRSRGRGCRRSLGAVVGALLLWHLIGIVRADGRSRQVPGASRARRGGTGAGSSSRPVARRQRRSRAARTGSSSAVSIVSRCGPRFAAARRPGHDCARRPRPDTPDGRFVAAEATATRPTSTGTGTTTVPVGAQLSPDDAVHHAERRLLPDRHRTVGPADRRVVVALEIAGMVTRPLSISYDDLLARPMIERMITIACVSNQVGGDLIGNAVWQGVRLDELLVAAGVDPAAEQVFMTSVDGWTCGFPVGVALDGRDAMVAIG
jgi:sulfite oxidase